MLLTAWPEPVSIDEILPWARSLERFGLGGFGWGVAWREEGAVRHHRDPGSLTEDEAGVRGLAGVRSTHYLVHLRRPSALTTIALADTQPFVADDASFSFAHNGTFDRAEELRAQSVRPLRGRADSEVGFRLFEQLRDEQGPERALGEVHQRMAGTANLCYLPASGAALAYHGAPANRMWSFNMGGARVISTGLHSADEAIFQLCFPQAAERRRLEVGQVVELGSVSSFVGADGGVRPAAARA